MTYDILKNITINFQKLFINCSFQIDHILFIKPFETDIEATIVLYQILHIIGKQEEKNNMENFIYKELLNRIIVKKCTEYLDLNNIPITDAFGNKSHLIFYNSITNYIQNNYIELTANYNSKSKDIYMT